MGGVASGQRDTGKQAGAAIGQTAGAAIGEGLGTALGGALGGPIGAVVGGVVGQKLGEKIGERIDDPLLNVTKAFRMAGKAVDFTSEAFQRIAKNDGIGLFAQGATAATDAIEDVPIVGKATAEGLRTLTKAVTGAYDVMSAFVAARQDVARLYTDLREAQKLGDKYERLVDAQTRMEQTIASALLPIKDVILTYLSVFIENANAYMINSLQLYNDMTVGLTPRKTFLRRSREAATWPVTSWTCGSAGSTDWKARRPRPWFPARSAPRP